LLISPSIPRAGGTTIVNAILIYTGQPSILKTGSSSRGWSRMPNISSSIKKFKKSLTKTKDLENS